MRCHLEMTLWRLEEEKAKTGRDRKYIFCLQLRDSTSRGPAEREYLYRVCTQVSRSGAQ